MTVVQWDASDYHQNSSMQQKLALELLDRFPFRGNERVLDIGCGDGKVTAEIARRVPNGSVLGVDVSDTMTRFAAASYPPSAAPNLSFQVCDARRLPFLDEFDRIVSFATMHWVSDHLSVLEGIHRGLKRGGRLLIQCGGKGNIADLLATAGEIITQEKWRDSFTGFEMPWSFYGVAAYEHWLRQVGLKTKRVELVSKEIKYPGEEAFTGWMRTTWMPYLQHLPEQRRPELIREIVERYIAQHPLDAEGFVHVPMVRLEVEAEKV